MMPIYRRRRLSKRTRSRSSYRVPFDPRVLQFRPSSSNHSHIIRPLLQLVQRQHTARIRQARSDMEKKLEEVNKRLEIFSELNDAYQALIDNLKGVQHDQTQRIEHLESTLERMRREQQTQQLPSSSNSTSSSPPSIKIVISSKKAAQREDRNANLPVTVSSDGSLSYATRSPSLAHDGAGGDHHNLHHPQQEEEESLETEIIYDFV